MIEVGSDLEILSVPFDARCTLLHILYSKHPCHRADAALLSLSYNWPKDKKKIPHQQRLVQQRQLVIYGAQ